MSFVRVSLKAPILTLLLSTVAASQVTFTEVGVQRGIAFWKMAPGKVGGVAAADFDSDGDIDIFAPTRAGLLDQLYQNQGNGTYVDIGGVAGVASVLNHRAALWFDYDADGRLDLLVSGDCVFGSCIDSSTILYRQSETGTFSDVTPSSGISLPNDSRLHAIRSGMCAGDVNNDGFLDVFISTWGGQSYLFINRNGKSFADVTGWSGIVGGPTSFYYQPMMVDVNHDGWMDIFIAVDNQPNELWINNQDGTFSNKAEEAGLDNTMNDMGVALGDYDNDGDLDIYVTNITRNNRHNVLFRNDSVGGDLSYTEVSMEVGVWQGHWDWGTTFLDCDNDGWLDLISTNAPVSLRDGEDASRLFHNLGSDPVQFEDKSTKFRFDDVENGVALMAFDYDRDGDQDILQACAHDGPLRLLENSPADPLASDRNYLVVRPRGVGPNTHAIGAVVRARVGALEMTRIITAGTSLLGQEPAEAFFGVGPAEVAEVVTIEWPNGKETTLFDVETNQVLTVRPESSFIRGDVDGNGNVELTDAVNILAYLFLSGTISCLDAADPDDDGRLRISDSIRLLFHLFASFPPPEAPWPECGRDGEDSLGCVGPVEACQ